MCGFVTIVTPPGAAVSGALLRRMTNVLAHRGPDDVGFACVDRSSNSCRSWGAELPDDEQLSGVVFGHRRLSILDLTPAGRQPAVSDDGSTTLCFNGAIYNFLELRKVLEGRGVAFRSRGDTELLLRACEQWGADALHRFNGMWAFTLWDGRRRRFVASRDRFGVKPLYYTVVDGAWVFASEIKALLAYPGAFRGFDDRNVLQFLGHRLIDHGESTLFRGVRAVPPGACIEIAGEQATHQRFWTLRIDGAHDGRPERELVAQFRELLTDAVRLRVRADVPIGTMLSGGLDSTSITALIHEQRRASATNGATWAAEGLRDSRSTFSACWPGWERDEEQQIDLLCAGLGLTPHKLYLTDTTAADVLPTVTYHLDQPFGTATPIAQFLLMRSARAQGVKVVLNGHGADETLAGYPGSFLPPFLAGLLLSGRPIAYMREHRAFSGSGEWTSRDVVDELLDALLPPALLARAGELTRVGRNRRRYDSLFPTLPASDSSSPAAVAPPLAMSRLNAALRLRFTERILPAWLRMEDRMSMASSVESRLPFLDHRLVEFAFNLPDGMKLKDGYTKYILRQAMRDVLPAPIAFQRTKRRFATPYHRWFRGAWRPMIEDLLLGSCHVESYVNLPRLRHGLRAYLAGEDSTLNSATLWRVLSTEVWLRTFADGGVARSRSP